MAWSSIINLSNTFDHVKIYDLLYRLGATANHVGFFHAAYAVHLAVEQPERLLLVTKWLYPDVAKFYHSNWRAVERNIRIIILEVWKNNPWLLSEIAGRPINSKPRPAEFISILAAALHPTNIAS